MGSELLQLTQLTSIAESRFADFVCLARLQYLTIHHAHGIKFLKSNGNQLVNLKKLALTADTDERTGTILEE